MLAFLFTDIEGSIRLWDAHPERMHRALADHDRIIHQTVEAVAGQIFAVTGDGFGAAFPSVDVAVEAAVAIQIELRAASFVPHFRVRAGIHTGPVLVRDANFYGPTINHCARLTAVAWGGQVVMSGESMSALGDPVDVSDLGEHVLKDLPRPMRIVQILHAQLPYRFPPLASLSSRHPEPRTASELKVRRRHQEWRRAAVSA